MNAGPVPEAVPPLSRLLSPGRSAEIAGPLLDWFEREQRDLPWRRDPEPYAVWVSEMMLQQTQVATVIPYFERWMARFPTVEALAAADEDEVLRAWEGLGYYSRARNLLRGARAVVQRHGGRVPEDPAQLRELPGIGPYTAGAIASIAFNVPAPLVDGNVIRVLSRIFALRGDPARAPLRGRIWELAEALIPEGRAGDFNPAMMELGATICVPGQPRCRLCPVAGACEGRRLGIQAELPETAARPQVTPVRMVAALVWRDGRVLLVQRRRQESRWPGMWQFPSSEMEEEETPSGAVRRTLSQTVGIEVEVGPRAALVRHSVTRYRIALEVYHCHAPEGEPRALGCAQWRWAAPGELGEYALPAAHRRIAVEIARGEKQLELPVTG